MSQIFHPAGEPQIRTSRSFLTELAPAPRISRCGRSWISKPERIGAGPKTHRKARSKPGGNSPHDPQFLVVANPRLTPAGRLYMFELFVSGRPSPNNLMRSR